MIRTFLILGVSCFAVACAPIFNTDEQALS